MSNHLSLQGVQGDVRDYEKCTGVIDAAVAAFGHLNILVNCAAGNFMSPAENLSSNGFKTVIEIDLLGSFNMARAAFDALKVTGDALIINISATLHYKVESVSPDGMALNLKTKNQSLLDNRRMCHYVVLRVTCHCTNRLLSTYYMTIFLASFQASPFQIHAASAKAGIDSLTRNLGIEWAEYGIRSVGIAPGPIAGTEGGPTGRVFGTGRKWDDKSVRALCPIGFFGEVDDIALTSVFMASEAARWITSETLVVDGGQWHDVGHKMQFMKAAIQKKSSKEKASRQPRSKL